MSNTICNTLNLSCNIFMFGFCIRRGKFNAAAFRFSLNLYPDNEAVYFLYSYSFYKFILYIQFITSFLFTLEHSNPPNDITHFIFLEFNCGFEDSVFEGVLTLMLCSNTNLSAESSICNTKYCSQNINLSKCINVFSKKHLC